MVKNELQKLSTELHDICDSLLVVELEYIFSPSSAENNAITTLIRLTTCIHSLKKYTLYNKECNELLDEIEHYTSNESSSLECIVVKTEELISKIDQILEVDLFASLKNECAEVKDTIADAIPGEVKTAYKSVVNTLHDVGRKAERQLKLKIKNWLLSDDNDGNE